MEIKDSMSVDEFNALLKHGKLRVGKKGKLVEQEMLPAFEKAVKENKFMAKKTEYNGDVYDSKKEANFAMKLESDPNVKRIEKQLPFDIIINDFKVCKYILDFKVTYLDDSIRYYDVKGYKKGAAYSVFRLKKKLMQAVLNINVEEV